jgi:phosphoadenosine phosphosulfate reductase
VSDLETTAVAFIGEQAAGKNIYVSVSGGMDSLVALDLAARAGVKKAVFCDTTIEYRETVEYVKTLPSFFDVELEIVSAPRDFFTVIREIGIPSRRARWCCDVFKFGPLAKFANERGVDSYITGLRSEESAKRADYGFEDENPLVPAKQLNPILHWSKENVIKYVKKYKLPLNPMYEHFDRVGCWLCPFRTDEAWKKTKKLYPQLVEKLEKELSYYARRRGFDEKEFIENNGWMTWIVPIKKRPSAIYSPCEKTAIFWGMDECQARRVEKILPILVEDFRRIGRRIRISTKGIPEVKINILIEKAINCIRCGACLAACPTGALFIDEESINVDMSRCTKCLRCLNTSILKGACVFRNYAPQRQTVAVEF